jgi:hypothetical protein
MTFELYTNAVLTRDIAEHDLRAGDVVKVIEHYAAPGARMDTRLRFLTLLVIPSR